MSRFLSPAWVDAFNNALADIDLSAAGGDASMVAAAGHFRIAQVVLDLPPDLAHDLGADVSRGHGTDTATSPATDGAPNRVDTAASPVPDAPAGLAGTMVVRTVLSMDDGRISLTLHHVTSPVDVSGPPSTDPDRGAIEPGALDVDDADVTVVLSYDDAAALSRAELDPVIALSTGRVRVRGDLSVLVAGQAVLAAASIALADLQAATTY